MSLLTPEMEVKSSRFSAIRCYRLCVVYFVFAENTRSCFDIGPVYRDNVND
jgi:hypothetical protein